MKLPFRPCVLAVFMNEQGQLLVGERSHYPGQWQFPQGGIDAGETAEDALYREMGEEIGSREFDIVRRGEEAVRYHFPTWMNAKIAKQWAGQDQVWFLVRFRASHGPDLGQASDAEFTALSWVTPERALEGIVDFKKEAYVKGLAQLGVLDATNTPIS